MKNWKFDGMHIYIKEKEPIVADIYADNNELLEKRGNLIKAAPDLLEAVVQALNDLDFYLRERDEPVDTDKTIIMLKAAIRKATEKTEQKVKCSLCNEMVYEKNTIPFFRQEIMYPMLGDNEYVCDQCDPTEDG